MDHTIKSLCGDRVFHHFYQISRIPRRSGNEREISDFLLNWARGLGLEAEQDEAKNVLIRKGASPGYETAPVTMLQAHMDMVCEKAEGVEHDFDKDPIQWVVDGNTLSTGGRTTLGADDGIGVALAMAILEDAELPHPALEALFTTMEEEDLSGAERFDTSKMRAKYLINLDHVNDSEILCGSCGGMQVDMRIPVVSEALPEDWSSYRLSVSGLKGGHSGEDIHRGRGNANIALARLLIVLENTCEYRLGSIKGGSFRLAIPREAEAVIWFDSENLARVRARLSEMEATLRSELPASANSIRVELSAVGAAPRRGVRPGRVIDAMVLVPDGIYQMNELFAGVVDTSDNLGEVYLDEHTLHFVLEIRSARESRRDYLFRRMERLAALFGGVCRSDNVYPSWSFRRDSALRGLCGGVYQELYGAQPKFLLVHAGLEVGCFFASKTDIDAVSIGPNCRDFHSASETLEISSVKKEYQYLRAVLSAIR